MVSVGSPRSIPQEILRSHPEAEGGCCMGWQVQWMSAAARHRNAEKPTCFARHPLLCSDCSLMEQFQGQGGMAGRQCSAGGAVTLPRPWARCKPGTALVPPVLPTLTTVMYVPCQASTVSMDVSPEQGKHHDCQIKQQSLQCFSYPELLNRPTVVTMMRGTLTVTVSQNLH